jgi:hypothetical protein
VARRPPHRTVVLDHVPRPVGNPRTEILIFRTTDLPRPRADFDAPTGISNE